MMQILIRATAIALVVLAGGALQAQAPSTPASQSLTPAAERLHARYWSHIVAVDPLDACTMGIRSACSRLPDLGTRAFRDRTAFEQATLEELSRLSLDELADELAKDMVAIRRLAEHWIATRHTQLGNLEYAENVPTLLILQAERSKSEDDWRQVARRLLGIEVLLQQQQQNLETAVDLGHAPDHVETLRVIQHVIPSSVRQLNEVLPAVAAEENLSPEMASGLDRAIASATGALHSHQSFLEQLVERLPHHWRPLGEAETARRLSRDGFNSDPRALFEESLRWIKTEQQRFVNRARIAGLDAPTFEAAVDSFNNALPANPESAADAIELYRELVDRLNTEAAKAGFTFPADYEVDVVPAPLGYGVVSSISNIPPVMRDPTSKPRFIVSIEPEFLSEHHPIRATIFAAHEATPGHAFAEAWWHERYAGHEAPISLAHRHDLVNAISGFWGTMAAIEGAGLLAESQLESSFSALERVAVAEGRLLRAVRVRVDVGLSAGLLDRETAAAELIHGLGMAPDAAHAAVLHRYSRRNFLGQAWTYFLGAQQIEALQADWKRANPGRSNHDFHYVMSQQPPLPAALLKQWLLN